MIEIGEMLIVNDAGRVLCKETVDKQGEWMRRGGADMTRRKVGHH